MSMFRFRRRPGVEGDGTPKISSSEGADALDALERFEQEHHLDPNIPADEIEAVGVALAAGDPEKALEVEVTLVEDDSPYPEVWPYPTRT